MKSYRTNLLVGTLLTTVVGCGGGGGSEGVATGSASFRVVWPGPSSSSPQAAFIGEIPAAVKAIRLILGPEGSPSEACCIAVVRGSAAFENRSIVINDLVPGDTELRFAAFADPSVPSDGTTKRCTVDSSAEASDCSSSTSSRQSFGADDVNFAVVANEITNAGTVSAYSLPFVVPVSPPRGGGIAGPSPSIRLSVVDAVQTVDSDIDVEIISSSSSQAIAVVATGPPSACLDTGLPLCTDNGELEVAGLTFTGQPEDPLTSGQYQVRVRASNEGDPSRSVDFRYPIEILESPPVTCEVFFELDGPLTIGSLAMDVDYSASPGGLRGNGEQVECEALTSAGLWAFNEDEDQELLSAAYAASPPLAGPSDLFRCVYEGTAVTSAGDFAVTVREATGTDPLDVIDPDDVPVNVRVVCDGSTTTTTTTTTTLPPPTETCTLTFRLMDDVNLGSLQWDTDYSNASGFFLGTGGDVQCAGLIEQGLPAFNDDDSGNLDSAVIKLSPGFTGPIDVAECLFVASGTAAPEDFLITVTEASTPDLGPVLPRPEVVVSSVDCGPVDESTTTSTTVSTSSTTLPVDTANYAITFRLLTASSTVGALQLKVDYSAAPGGFQGVGPDVACTSTQQLPAFFDEDGNSPPSEPAENLNLGYIALSPFAAPTDLATCTFNGIAGVPPTSGDFAITIIDATSGSGVPISVTVGSSVAAIP